MTATAEKTKRETWVDWLRRGAIDEADIERTGTLTRDELLKRLADGGIDVSPYDLENWQQAGFIPYGIRRRHQGATRVIYPWWMVDIVRTLRQMQREDLAPLSRISPQLVVQALRFYKPRDVLPAPQPPAEIEQAMRRWAASHEATYGIPIRYTEVSLIDERGHPLIFRFDLRD